MTKCCLVCVSQPDHVAVCPVLRLPSLHACVLDSELEAANRSLQQQVHSLQQDQAEVTQLLADYRAEQAAHSTLQAAHKALQVGVL